MDHLHCADQLSGYEAEINLETETDVLAPAAEARGHPLP